MAGYEVFQLGMHRKKFYMKQYRLSSTLVGNREMDQLYTTSQVSNITRKTKFFHIS